MKKEEIVNEVISALERKNWETLESRLADDFTYSGALPKPIQKRDFVGVQRALHSGMPDLKFNLHQVAAKGDKIICKVKLEGTHSATLPPPMEGYKPIPSTGKKVTLPEEELEFTFSGEKISNLYVKPVPHGGVN